MKLFEIRFSVRTGNINSASRKRFVHFSRASPLMFRQAGPCTLPVSTSRTVHSLWIPDRVASGAPPGSSPVCFGLSPASRSPLGISSCDSPSSAGRKLDAKATRRPQRRKRRSDKRPCSSTIEELSSSVNRVRSQRKRARCYMEPAPPSSLIHIQTAIALHLHINTFRSLDSTSHRTVHHERPLFTVLSPTASGSKRTASMKVASARRHGPT